MIKIKASKFSELSMSIKKIKTSQLINCKYNNKNIFHKYIVLCVLKLYLKTQIQICMH